MNDLTRLIDLMDLHDAALTHLGRICVQAYRVTAEQTPRPQWLSDISGTKSDVLRDLAAEVREYAAGFETVGAAQGYAESARRVDLTAMVLGL